MSKNKLIMKRDFRIYRELRGIGISKENSRTIVKKQYSFEGIFSLSPLILYEYLQKLKNGETKETIKRRLEEIFIG